MRRLFGRDRGDAGQTAVEFLGIIPYLILGGLAVLQLAVAVATVQGTSTAARAAARTVSQADGDATTSARRAVPDWLAGRITVSVTGGVKPGVAVTATMPVVLPGVDGPNVTRRAWFDPEQGPSPWG
ncbi:MAG: pilus assembly protein [Kineosporiaceae bacterium]|nr:pilus assembly protein [Kineosporiaceae bacterium]